MTMTHDQVFDKVRGVLEEALGVDEDEVTPEATLNGDLGAESIDYLDISFQLEKAFQIKIQQGEMIPENALQNAEYVQNGQLTEAGLAELKTRMPYADLTPLEQDPRVDNLTNVFTVSTLVKFVEQKLDAQGSSSASQGS